MVNGRVSGRPWEAQGTRLMVEHEGRVLIASSSVALPAKHSDEQPVSFTLRWGGSQGTGFAGLPPSLRASCPLQEWPGGSGGPEIAPSSRPCQPRQKAQELPRSAGCQDTAHPGRPGWSRGGRVTPAHGDSGGARGQVFTLQTPVTWLPPGTPPSMPPSCPSDRSRHPGKRT